MRTVGWCRPRCLGRAAAVARPVARWLSPLRRSAASRTSRPPRPTSAVARSGTRAPAAALAAASAAAAPG
eukprot:scaffold45378_cov45-Phaeocystis_antarctica.AAC.1